MNAQEACGGDTRLTSGADMTANRHNYFRWTPRTARITFMYAVVVPVIIGVIGYKTDVSFSWPPGRTYSADHDTRATGICAESARVIFLPSGKERTMHEEGVCTYQARNRSERNRRAIHTDKVADGYFCMGA